MARINSFFIDGYYIVKIVNYEILTNRSALIFLVCSGCLIASKHFINKPGQYCPSYWRNYKQP